MKYIHNLKSFKKINEGSDWYKLLSLDSNKWAIDPQSGYIYNVLDIMEEYEPHSPKWNELYNKLSQKEKEMVDKILEELKENE